MLAWAMMYNFLNQAYLFKAEIDLKIRSQDTDTVPIDTLVRNGVIMGFYLLIAVIICLPGIRSKMKTSITTVLLTMIAAVAFLALQVMKIV